MTDRIIGIQTNFQEFLIPISITQNSMKGKKRNYIVLDKTGLNVKKVTIILTNKPKYWVQPTKANHRVLVLSG